MGLRGRGAGLEVVQECLIASCWSWGCVMGTMIALWENAMRNGHCTSLSIHLPAVSILITQLLMSFKCSGKLHIGFR